MYWITYECIKQMSEKPTTFTYNFIAGSIAGAVIYFNLPMLLFFRIYQKYRNN